MARPEEALAPYLIAIPRYRVGDVVFDGNGDDWEVVSRPVGIAKKHIIARVRVPGRPETGGTALGGVRAG